MAATKIKGLQMWCRRMTDGYAHVDIANFTSSWRDGMAFCALIHRFRPDLIDYDSLSPENVFENCKLAFEVAEQELDIPAFLEAEDMAALKAPDKLSVITYVSQYYNILSPLPQLGGPGVRSKLSNKTVSGTKRPTDSDRNYAPAKRTLVNETKENTVQVKVTPSVIGDVCAICQNRVYLMERHMDSGKLYHRSCFRHSELSPTNKVYTRSPFLSPSLSSETPSFTYPSTNNTDSVKSNVEKSSKDLSQQVTSEPKMTTVVASVYKKSEAAGTKHHSIDPVRDIAKKSKLSSDISLDEEKSKKASAIIDRLQNLKAKYSGHKVSEGSSPLPLSGKEARKIEKKREEVLASLRPVEEPVKGSRRSVPLILQQNDKLASGALKSDVVRPLSTLSTTITPILSSSASVTLSTTTSTPKPDSVTVSTIKTPSATVKSKSSPQSAHFKNRHTDVENREKSVDTKLDSALLKKNILSKAQDPETVANSSGQFSTAQPIAKPRTGASRAVGGGLNQDVISTKTNLNETEEQRIKDTTPKPTPRKNMFDNLEKTPASELPKPHTEQPKILERTKFPLHKETGNGEVDSSILPSANIPPPLPTSPPPQLPASNPVGKINPSLTERDTRNQSNELIIQEAKSSLEIKINESDKKSDSYGTTSQNLPLEDHSSNNTAHSSVKSETTDSHEAVTRTDSSEVVNGTDSTEAVNRKNSPVAVTRTDSPVVVTRTDIPETVNRTDSPEAVTRTDIPEAVTRTYIPETVNRTDIPETVNRTDIPETVNRTDIPETVNRTDIPETVNRTDIPETVNRTDIPEAVTRTDSPETVTRKKSTSGPFDGGLNSPISANELNMAEFVVLAEDGSEIEKAFIGHLKPLSIASGGMSSSPDSSNVTLTPLVAPPVALSSIVHTPVPLSDSAIKKTESKLDSCESSANETSSTSMPDVLSKSKNDTNELSREKTLRTNINLIQSETVDTESSKLYSQQNVDKINNETPVPEVSVVNTSSANNANFESKFVLNLVVEDAKINSENRNNQSEHEQDKPHPTPAKRRISRDELKSASSSKENKGIFNKGKIDLDNSSIDVRQVQLEPNDGNIHTNKESAKSEGIPQKPPRIFKMAKLASQEKKTPDQNLGSSRFSAIADKVEATSLQASSQPHIVPTAIVTTDEAKELPQWKKDIEERKKKLREDIAKSESETVRFKHLREKGLKKTHQNPDIAGQIETTFSSQNKPGELIDDNTIRKSGNNKDYSSSSSSSCEQSDSINNLQEKPEKILAGLGNGEGKNQKVTNKEDLSQISHKTWEEKQNISESDHNGGHIHFNKVDLESGAPFENADTEECSISNEREDNGGRRISVLSEGKLVLQTSNKDSDENKDKVVSPRLRRKITVIGRANKDAPNSPPSSPLPMKKIEVTTKFNFEESSSDFENSLDESVSKLNIHDIVTRPPRPPPPQLHHKTVPPLQISAIELQQQLLDIDSKLTDLELRGRGLEESIRNENTLEEEEDELINDWFKMVCERNELVRKEADLVYISKQQDLEDEQEHIESQLRYLISKPYDCKSVEEKQEENYLIKRKLELVEQRNKIVDSMDEDRIRYETEDRDIKMMKDTGLWKKAAGALGSLKVKKVSKSVFYS